MTKTTDSTTIQRNLDAAIGEQVETAVVSHVVDTLINAAANYRAVYGDPTPRAITPEKLAIGQVLALVQGRDNSVTGGKVTAIERDHAGQPVSITLNHGREVLTGRWLDPQATEVIVHKNAPVEEPDESH